MTTTYADIAQNCQKPARAAEGSKSTEKGLAKPFHPLSFAQQRLWFLDKLHPGSPAYNVPTVVKLRGPLQLDALRQGLNALVARHESLRTTFEEDGELPAQKVNPPGDAGLELVDLAGKNETAGNAEAERIIDEEIRKPFNLANDSMVRAKLLRLQAEEHILILVLHHIASDEWSLRILFREWAEYYAAYSAGREPVLPELSVSYVEFAKWQRSWAEGSEYEEQLAYWRRRLQSAPVLQLPTDRSRPTSQTFNGALKERWLPKELADGLKAFSRQEKCTLFMTLLAGFKVLLHRYTRQEEIVVGSPVAGRNRLETEALIGFFVNTLALKTTIRGDTSFRSVLRQVRETTLGACANQDLPFDKLVEELHPQRSATHMPFVQVVFSFVNELVEEQLFPGIQSEEIEVDTLASKFDLTVVAKDTPQGLRLVVEFNTDLFERERIDRLLGHYQCLLESILDEPDQRISKLALLTPEERRPVLVDWNDTARAYPRDASVTQVFERQVAKTPDSVALEYSGRTVTYRELNARANQLAHYLIRRGAGPGGFVGVYMERSIEMVTAFLGILKAGSAYVPLDLSYPRERLQFMRADCAMPLILTTSALQDELPEGRAGAVCLDTEWQVIERETRRLPTCASSGESLAYIIYTSGSTGQPKGVSVPHRAITRLVLNTDYVNLTAADRIAQASNASFDAATFEIWGALLNGACVVGVNKDIALSPSEFQAFLRREKITTLFLTTALFNQVAREAPSAFGSLETLLFGGEAVDPKWVRAVIECAPPRRLLHVYGPTENTTFSSWHLVREVPEEASTIPIGRPIANSTLYILGPEMEPVPAGIPGEVYVGGDGLACGYWNRPELTAARFVPNPFSVDEKARLYKTGDLARFDKNGNVEFIGRVDHQVKLRGFRIELGEIESLLVRHPAVAEAAVMLREDTPGDRRLVAYIIARKPAPGIAELKSFLKLHLPEYMVPAAFVLMEKFPLTPNEKIDRMALPVPEQNRPELGKSFVAPRDPLEKQLAQIWEKVLDVKPVGASDNFFDLGGHSLLAVRLFSEIEKGLNRKLPLATLFRAPTIEEIARVIRDDNQSESWSTIVEIQPHGSRPPLYWVHSLGGDGGGGFFYYRKLAELLGEDQPSFGIRSPQEPFCRIEQMAAFYLREIRERQPRGPYFLGGFCFGGNVAFEMAQQLSAAGEEIGLLVILESSAPNVSSRQSWSATAAKYSLENFVENVKGFVTESPQRRLSLLKAKGRRLRQRFTKRVGPPQEGKVVSLNQILDLSTYPQGYVKYAETHWRALTEYHPKPYPGMITLFRARKQGLSNFNHTLGWDALGGDRVDVTVIPGSHESMLQEPNVQIVAAKLRALLDKAATQRHWMVSS